MEARRRRGENGRGQRKGAGGESGGGCRARGGGEGKGVRGRVKKSRRRESINGAKRTEGNKEYERGSKGQALKVRGC
eukprot:6208356-Pleurochrysis_carterae.AAC.2